MSDGPEFASVNGARVAYETHGQGDLDIAYSPGVASHLDMAMESPRYRHFVDSLARFGRVIRFDRRGTGISDPTPPDAGESWEVWADDLRAVLDATSSRETTIVSTNDAGGAALLFAATHPERVRALVLFNTSAKFTLAPGYPQGHPPEVAQAVVQTVRTTWGTEKSIELLAPSQISDEPFRRWYPRFQRAAISPTAMAETMDRVLRMDARHVLAEVQCPTLVIHRSDYGVIPQAQGEYIANHVPHGTFLTVPGADAVLITEGLETIIAAIGEFLGTNPATESDDRQFSTVLFTDIVASTEQAAALGDQAWHRVLDAHDGATRAAVQAAGGRFIKSTGDGVLATFDSPSRAIQCARDIHLRLRALGLEVRVGLHAGPVLVRHDGDIGGLAVHAAARVMTQAGAGELWVSSSIVGLVTDSAMAFAPRGLFDLKGVPGPHELFSATLCSVP